MKTTHILYAALGLAIFATILWLSSRDYYAEHARPPVHDHYETDEAARDGARAEAATIPGAWTLDRSNTGSNDHWLAGLGSDGWFVVIQTPFDELRKGMFVAARKPDGNGSLLHQIAGGNRKDGYMLGGAANERADNVWKIRVTPETYKYRVLSVHRTEE